MLQSIKRAYKLHPDHPKLHSCLIRFSEVINRNKGNWDPIILEVVNQEVAPFFKGKDAAQMNKEFLEMNSNRLDATLEGAKMMYYLDPKSLSTALSLVTSLDNKFVDVNTNVSIFFFLLLYVV